MNGESTDTENKEAQKKKKKGYPLFPVRLDFKSEASASQEDFIPPPAGDLPFAAK